MRVDSDLSERNDRQKWSQSTELVILCSFLVIIWFMASGRHTQKSAP